MNGVMLGPKTVDIVRAHMLTRIGSQDNLERDLEPIYCPQHLYG